MVRYPYVNTLKTSSDGFLFACTARIRTQTKLGPGRPNRVHEWLQSDDHRKKTKNVSDPLICVQQSNTMFINIKSLTVPPQLHHPGPTSWAISHNQYSPSSSFSHFPYLTHSLTILEYSTDPFRPSNISQSRI